MWLSNGQHMVLQPSISYILTLQKVVLFSYCLGCLYVKSFEDVLIDILIYENIILVEIGQWTSSQLLHERKVLVISFMSMVLVVILTSLTLSFTACSYVVLLHQVPSLVGGFNHHTCFLTLLILYVPLPCKVLVV